MIDFGSSVMWKEWILKGTRVAENAQLIMASLTSPQSGDSNKHATLEAVWKWLDHAQNVSLLQGASS